MFFKIRLIVSKLKRNPVIQKFLFLHIVQPSSISEREKKAGEVCILHFAYSRYIELRPLYVPCSSIRTRNKQFAFRQSRWRALRETKEVKPILDGHFLFTMMFDGSETHRANVTGKSDIRVQLLKVLDPSCWEVAEVKGECDDLHSPYSSAERRNQFTPCGIHYGTT